MSCKIQHTDQQEGAASTHQELVLNQRAEEAGQRGPNCSDTSWSLPRCPDSYHAALWISLAGRCQAGYLYTPRH